MPTEELCEIRESEAVAPAIPGWVWSDHTREEPVEDRDGPIDLSGILDGLGALLDAIGMLSPDAIG